MAIALEFRVVAHAAAKSAKASSLGEAMCGHLALGATVTLPPAAGTGNVDTKQQRLIQHAQATQTLASETTERDVGDLKHG